MDKVIIDGIDVSECKYYDDGTCCDKDVMSLDCENTDCIYKQLKRLEQENERLKEESENYAIQLGVLAQALEDIRDIANIIYNTNCNYVAESHKIIAKINEVIGAEE